jgi:hypothetical protein
MVNVPTGGPTLIVLTPISPATAPTLTPYSARGATQTLDLISGVSGGALGTVIQRDINGTLLDLTNPAFRKYQSVIACRDSETPGLDAGWLGAQVTFDSAAELAYPSGGSPARTPVTGSERSEGSTVFYRPVLTMMVFDIKNSFDEYNSRYSYSISMQEI